MSQVASIRLTPEEELEMSTYGFKNASEYIKYKLGKVNPEELSGIQGLQEGTKLIQPTKNEGMSKEDAVRMAKLEFERDKLQTELKELLNQQRESLGSVELTVAERLHRYKEEDEKNRLKKLAEENEANFKQLKSEHEEVVKKYKKAKKKLKAITDLKENAPMLSGLLGAVTQGVSKMSEGGFWTGIGQIGENLAGISGGTKLSAEDEKAMSLGKDIRGMFTPEDFQKVMNIIAFFATEKEHLDDMPQILIALKNRKIGESQQE